MSWLWDEQRELEGTLGLTVRRVGKSDYGWLLFEFQDGSLLHLSWHDDDLWPQFHGPPEQGPERDPRQLPQQPTLRDPHRPRFTGSHWRDRDVSTGRFLEAKDSGGSFDGVRRER